MKCLRSLFLLAVVSLHAALFAQVGKPRTDLAIGGSAGVVLNRISFNPSIKQSMKPGMTVAFSQVRISAFSGIFACSLGPA